MPDPTSPPTPAEIAEIRAVYEKYGLCLETWHAVAAHLPGLLSAASRGIAPPSGEVGKIIKRMDDYRATYHVGPGAREIFDDAVSLLLRLSAPPVAATDDRMRDALAEMVGAFDSTYPPASEGMAAQTAWCERQAEAIKSAIAVLSAPPVAAPSGEAAPREAKPHTKKFTAEYYRALADGTKGVDAETFEDALNHAAYLADSVRTLSDGKAAAEARAERLRDHYECKMSGAERGTRLEAWATDAERGRAAAESRCAALERALTITRGQWIHSVHADECLAALSSAETAKPEMPEAVKRAVGAGEELADRASWNADEQVAEWRHAKSEVESYYAKPSATAGTEEGEG